MRDSVYGLIAYTVVLFGVGTAFGIVVAPRGDTESPVCTQEQHYTNVQTVDNAGLTTWDNSGTVVYTGDCRIGHGD